MHMSEGLVGPRLEEARARPAGEEAQTAVLRSTNYKPSSPGMRDHTTKAAQSASEEAVTAEVRGAFFGQYTMHLQRHTGLPSDDNELRLQTYDRHVSEGTRAPARAESVARKERLGENLPLSYKKNSWDREVSLEEELGLGTADEVSPLGFRTRQVIAQTQKPGRSKLDETICR